MNGLRWVVALSGLLVTCGRPLGSVEGDGATTSDAESAVGDTSDDAADEASDGGTREAGEESGSPINDLPPVPPCESEDVFDGHVSVKSYADLEALEGVRCITGDLVFGNYDDVEVVPDLLPLWVLEEVLGSVVLYYSNVNPVPLVETLEGLSQLRHVGGLRIESVPHTRLDGLENLESIGDAGLSLMGGYMPLADIDGLESLSTVAGSVSLWKVDDISGLSSLETVGGDLVLWDVPVSDLGALFSAHQIGGELNLRGMPMLSTLAGLDGVSSLASLVLWNNDLVESLEGIEQVSAVGRVIIVNNPSLSTCEIQAFLQTIDMLEYAFVKGNLQDCTPEGTCAPMDVVVEGPCDAQQATTWDGTHCYGADGCSCEGSDCLVGKMFDSIEECEEAFASCL